MARVWHLHARAEWPSGNAKLGVNRSACSTGVHGVPTKSLSRVNASVELSLPFSHAILCCLPCTGAALLLHSRIQIAIDLNYFMSTYRVRKHGKDYEVTGRIILLWWIAQTVANTIPIMVIKLAIKIIYAPLNHPGRNTTSMINVTSMVSLIK